MNIDDYVSFEIPNSIESQIAAADAGQLLLSATEMQAARQALGELAQTAEGREAIIQAAENSSDGKIHIINNPGGFTAAYRSYDSNTILIGDQDDGGIYQSPEDGQWYNMSIQRMLFHELTHFDGDGMSAHEESRAIEASNDFMDKYYGELPRSTDSMDPNVVRFQGGDEGWNLNPNFSLQRASMELDIPEGPFEAAIGTDERVIADVNAAGANLADNIIPAAGATHQGPTSTPTTFNI